MLNAYSWILCFHWIMINVIIWGSNAQHIWISAVLAVFCYCNLICGSRLIHPGRHKSCRVCQEMINNDHEMLYKNGIGGFIQIKLFCYPHGQYFCHSKPNAWIELQSSVYHLHCPCWSHRWCFHSWPEPYERVHPIQPSSPVPAHPNWNCKFSHDHPFLIHPIIKESDSQLTTLTFSQLWAPNDLWTALFETRPQMSSVLGTRPGGQQHVWYTLCCLLSSAIVPLLPSSPYGRTWVSVGPPLPTSHVFHALSHMTVLSPVGYAKNRAVQQSTGEFLCFLDAVSTCWC